MGTSPLAELTAVTRRGDGDYVAAATADVGIVGGLVHGGFLLEVAARALADAVGAPHPVTITGHYLTAVRPGPLRVRTEVLRVGRHRTGRALLFAGDGDAPALAVTGTFLDLAAATGPTRRLVEPPPLPDPEACTPWPPPDRPVGADAPPSVMDRFRHRLVPDGFAWIEGRPSGNALVEAWAAPEAGDWDPLDLLTLTDVYPPPILSTGMGFAWVPTVELTVQLRGLPDGDEWLASRFATSEVTGGYVEEDGTVRTASGRLIAISRQLALVPREVAAQD
jgi:acyl-coenzyme A thioesterase PaaI-like protein